MKPPLRTKTLGTKLSEPEYAQLEAAASERRVAQVSNSGAPLKPLLLEWEVNYNLSTNRISGWTYDSDGNLL
ncbi:MAG: hypothetical protein WA655_02335, partial [Candidatus Korobacteraceae bacterium]